MPVLGLQIKGSVRGYISEPTRARRDKRKGGRVVFVYLG